MVHTYKRVYIQHVPSPHGHTCRYTRANAPTCANRTIVRVRLIAFRTKEGSGAQQCNSYNKAHHTDVAKQPMGSALLARWLKLLRGTRATIRGKMQQQGGGYYNTTGVICCTRVYNARSLHADSIVYDRRRRNVAKCSADICAERRLAIDHKCVSLLTRVWMGASMSSFPSCCCCSTAIHSPPCAASTRGVDASPWGREPALLCCWPP